MPDLFDDFRSGRWTEATPCKRRTDAPPGSMAKIRVMRQRLERGEALFHPDDERQCRNAGLIKPRQQFARRVLESVPVRVLEGEPGDS